MGLTSHQVCMDLSDWFQGTIHEETAMDSSSSPSLDILTCSRPLIERRIIRPQHDLNPKCPRCDSSHTKFCHYNNYSLTQPRYFCKTCRRYWTKGGTLRNIPVGGGCRKNKKVSSKKAKNHDCLAVANQNPNGLLFEKGNDLQLSFSGLQFSHLGNFGCVSDADFGNAKYNMMIENNVPIDFMENKYEALVGHGDHMGMIGGFDGISCQELGTNFEGFCSPFGTIMDNSQRLMMPYESQEDQSGLDVKPNPKLLSLDWDNFGYLGGFGSWTGLMNGYGSSSTNPLSLN